MIVFLIALTSFAFSNNLDSKIDSFLKRYQGTVPGVSCLVVKDGEAIYQKSFGLADFENNIKVTNETSFRLASVTKQFTAMATLILVDQEKISLDTRVAEVLIDLPHYARKVTVRHLLTHQSGLRRYERNLPPGQTQPLSDRDVYAIMSGLRSGLSSPGARYKYSNSGYALLAVLIEEVSGESFTQFVKKNIFDPLGMRTAVAHVEGETQIASRAYGHSKRGNRYIRTDQNIFSSVLGDGGIYMSISDYFLWDKALREKTLVSPRLHELAFSKSRLNGGGLVNYGFGWRVDVYRGYRRVHHTGSSIGFKNVTVRIPTKGLSVTLLSNRNHQHTKEIANQIANLFF